MVPETLPTPSWLSPNSFQTLSRRSAIILQTLQTLFLVQTRHPKQTPSNQPRSQLRSTSVVEEKASLQAFALTRAVQRNLAGGLFLLKTKVELGFQTKLEKPELWISENLENHLKEKLGAEVFQALAGPRLVRSVLSGFARCAFRIRLFNA